MWRIGLLSLRWEHRPGWCPTWPGRVYEMAELVRTYLHAHGKHRLILSVPLPGNANHVFRAGANLAPDRAVGRRTWEEVLAGKVTSPSLSRTGPA